MKFEITGTVKKVFELKQVTEKFAKREFVLDIEDGKYPQTILFEATGKALDYIGDFAPGDKMTAHFNVRGREWRSPSGETKYFTTLAAWRVDKVGERAASSGASSSDSDPIPF